MRATWYVLEDGNVADPNDCAPDAAGVLRHQDGVAVARRGDAYSSRGVDLSDEAPPKPPKAARSRTSDRNRQVTAGDGGKTYETR